MLKFQEGHQSHVLGDILDGIYCLGQLQQIQSATHLLFILARRFFSLFFVFFQFLRIFPVFAQCSNLWPLYLCKILFIFQLLLLPYLIYYSPYLLFLPSLPYIFFFYLPMYASLYRSATVCSVYVDVFIHLPKPPTSRSVVFIVQQKQVPHKALLAQWNQHCVSQLTGYF